MFEKVKEMIDSTIYTNGRGEVTAQNVNLAMQAIVEATEGKIVSLEENGLSSSGPLRVWIYQNDMSELTQQQVDDNIATYNAIASGDTTPVLVCAKFEDDSVVSVSTYHATSDYVAYSNGQKFVTVTICVVDADLLVTAVIIELNADGTMGILYGEDSASSGPLRVWVPRFTELTEEQKVENADTLAELANGYAGLVYIISQVKMQEENVYGFNTFTNVAEFWEAGVIEEGPMAFLSSNIFELYLYEDGTVEIFDE